MKLDRIGKGGSGFVYRVLDPKRRICALKEVDLRNQDEATRESFLNEQHLLQQLQGEPCIIKLVASEMDEESMVLRMVMECGDVDLARILQDLHRNRAQGAPKYPCIDENHLRLYIQQMLEAVACIHEHSIVHGDLKPANFLSVKGNLKLIDFGIASGIEVSLTRTHSCGATDVKEGERERGREGGRVGERENPKLTQTGKQQTDRQQTDRHTHTDTHRHTAIHTLQSCWA